MAIFGYARNGLNIECSQKTLLNQQYRLMHTLTKPQRVLYRQWIKGKINLIVAARKLGYKGGAMSKGVQKVRTLLSQMGIAIM